MQSHITSNVSLASQLRISNKKSDMFIPQQASGDISIRIEATPQDHYDLASNTNFIVQEESEYAPFESEFDRKI
jgi:hypothetical protein